MWIILLARVSGRALHYVSRSGILKAALVRSTRLLSCYTFWFIKISFINLWTENRFMKSRRRAILSWHFIPLPLLKQGVIKEPLKDAVTSRTFWQIRVPLMRSRNRHSLTLINDKIGSIAKSGKIKSKPLYQNSMWIFPWKSGITGSFAAVWRFVSIMYCVETDRFSAGF